MIIRFIVRFNRMKYSPFIVSRNLSLAYCLDYKLPKNKSRIESRRQELMGAQWLSGIVLDSRQRGCMFEPHRHHCVVVLEQGTFILA